MCVSINNIQISWQTFMWLGMNIMPLEYIWPLNFSAIDDSTIIAVQTSDVKQH